MIVSGAKRYVYEGDIRIAPFEKKVKGGKKMRNEAYAERSLAIIDAEFSHLKA